MTHGANRSLLLFVSAVFSIHFLPEKIADTSRHPRDLLQPKPQYIDLVPIAQSNQDWMHERKARRSVLGSQVVSARIEPWRSCWEVFVRPRDA